MQLSNESGRKFQPGDVVRISSCNRSFIVGYDPSGWYPETEDPWTKVGTFTPLPVPLKERVTTGSRVRYRFGGHVGTVMHVHDMVNFRGIVVTYAFVALDKEYGGGPQVWVVDDQKMELLG